MVSCWGVTERVMVQRSTPGSFHKPSLWPGILTASELCPQQVEAAGGAAGAAKPHTSAPWVVFVMACVTVGGELLPYIQ